MLPYSVDPRWYEITWYGVPSRPRIGPRRNILVRIGLSSALVIGSFVALGQVI
jgi:hypothetical protein